MSEDFFNKLIMIVHPYISEDDLQKVQMQIQVLLHDYTISKSENAIEPYRGNINERVLLSFLESKLAKGCSKRTILFYRQTIVAFFSFVEKPFNEVTADDIRFYLAKRVVKDEVSKTTANNERRNLSSFYTWLQKEEILLKNPMAKVERIKVTRNKKKAFSLMELELIRNACKTNRERAIIEILISTWCRVSELIGIKTSDIHDGKCTVHGKGDKYRDVYLNARAQMAIQSYMEERNDTNPFLFPKSRMNIATDSDDLMRKAGGQWYLNPELVSADAHTNDSTIEGICRKIGKRAGVENVHPHRFRRTGATMALRQGMPVMLVSKILGHESIETTQIYLDISDSELEEAHRKYVV